jgi:hypothetical protein
MPKFSLLIAAALLATSLPAMAQSEEHREHSAMQHIGGHWRHQHRDWSGSSGQPAHVHNVCWDWDVARGWVWNCSR